MLPCIMCMSLTSLLLFSPKVNSSMLIIPLPYSYGYPFLHHTYTYHLSRVDHRHNFSPYNILLYLVSSPSGHSSIPFASIPFLPQMLLSAVILPIAFAKKDLPSTLFAQTFAFVTFNKVCTSQVSPVLIAPLPQFPWHDPQY